MLGERLYKIASFRRICTAKCEQVEQQIEKYIEQYHASVFLVTEDGNIYDDLRNKFGENIKIVSYDSFIY